MLQTIRNVNQLSNTLGRFASRGVVTYKLSTINLLILLDEIVDISIVHPLGNQSEPVFTHCHSNEWQDVRMSKVSPSNTLSTESLRSVHSYVCDGAGGKLTLRMTSRSLVV